MFKENRWNVYLYWEFSKSQMTHNGKLYISHITNNKNWECFLSKLRNSNKQLKCKPYPMHNIDELLLKL